MRVLKEDIPKPQGIRPIVSVQPRWYQFGESRAFIRVTNRSSSSPSFRCVHSAAFDNRRIRSNGIVSCFAIPAPWVRRTPKREAIGFKVFPRLADSPSRVQRDALRGGVCEAERGGVRGRAADAVGEELAPPGQGDGLRTRAVEFDSSLPSAYSIFTCNHTGEPGA